MDENPDDFVSGTIVDKIVNSQILDLMDDDGWDNQVFYLIFNCSQQH